MKIAVISDVHNKWKKLQIEECDLLISCGDYSFTGEWDIIKRFHTWLDEQPAKHIISLQGNHEKEVEKNFEKAKALVAGICPAIHFIEEGLIEIEGIKIWCSAVTPFFHNWAYNRYGHEIQPHWDKIPLDTDILVTHGPPYGILDTVNYADGTPKSEHLGCVRLYEKVLEVKPDLHLFGHIHSAQGELHRNGTSFYNASICDEMYMPSNPVTYIDYEKEAVDKP